MVFSSVIFIGIFLPIVLSIYFIMRGRTARNTVLLVASLFFYAWGEPKWIFAMAGLTFLDYLFALWMEKTERQSAKKVLLLTAVAANLLLLFVVKYYDFFAGTISGVTGVNVPVFHIRMPIGISFFTFQALTYVVDVYRKDAKVQRNYFNLLLYISMFPQLIAGPIVRYADIDEQIQNRQETMQGFVNGMFRFSIGLGKKVVFANYAGYIANTLLTENFDNLSTAAAWIGILLFSMQLYFDFSGYSDMAIGLGKVFGFEYKENFNYPYISNSATDFWRRWHISLGSFFRDYVYIPLGGNRRHQYVNLLVVWVLTGLWHGASWNFVIWGLFHVSLLMIEKYLGKKGIHIEEIPIVGRLLVLILISYSMSLFFFTDIHRMWQCTKYFFGVGQNIALTLAEKTIVYKYMWIIPVMAVACTPFPARAASKLFKEGTALGNLMRSVMFVVLMLVCFMLILNQTYNPFLYFRF